MSAQERIKDVDWVRQAFMLEEKDMTIELMKLQVLTEASYKFTDTTLGGNFTINNPPQLTRFADIKMGGNKALVYAESTKTVIDRRRRAIEQGLREDGWAGGTSGAGGSSISYGMGRAYSEVIEKYGQIVTMRFGVPEFNSLTRFFGNFYSHGASVIARTGSGGGLFFGAGELIGSALAIPFFPLILGGKIVRMLTDKPASKFCYLKPTMPLYWAAVDQIVNAISVNKGLTQRFLTPEQQKVIESGDGFKEINYKAYHDALPDVISPEGRINTYAVATRAQRLNAHTRMTWGETFRRLMSTAKPTIRDYSDAVEAEKQFLLDAKNNTFPKLDKSFNDYIAAYNNVARNAYPDQAKDAAYLTANEDGSGDTREDMNRGNGVLGKMAEFYDAERRDGSNYVSFRVNHTGPASESFSNSSQPLEIQGKFNSAAGAARMARFNVAEGNIGDGAVAGMIEGVLAAARNTANGILEGFSLSGLTALMGSGFLDMPEQWAEASMQMPSQSFTMELRSPYGNKLSQMMNLYVPLAMILAGCLPRSAGKSSWVAPFMCECFSRGRSMSRYAMIDSVSVTRGVGNKGWTEHGDALAIDVTFTVKNLSQMMYMPITPGFKAGAGLMMKAADALDGESDLLVAGAAHLLDSTWDDENTFTDYMAVLGALSLQDMTYPSNRWRLNVSRTVQQYKTFGTIPHVMNVAMGTFPGRMINAFSAGTDRR